MKYRGDNKGGSPCFAPGEPGAIVGWMAEKGQDGLSRLGNVAVPAVAEAPSNQPLIGNSGGARRDSREAPDSVMTMFSSCTMILPGA